MDPFNMPDINAPVNYGQNLGQTLDKVAPLATTYHGALSTQGSVQYGSGQGNPAKPGVLSQFASKIASFGTESAHILEGAGKWLVNVGKDAITSVPRFAINSVKVGGDAIQSYENNQASKQLTNRLQNLTSAWRNGTISNDQFKSEMNQWKIDNQNLSDKINGLTAKINTDGNQLESSTIDAVSTVVAALTDGAGGGLIKGLSAGKTAAVDYLSSKEIASVISPVEKQLSRVALDKTLFTSMDSGAQTAVKDSILNTMYNAGDKVPASKLARSAAANLLLQYPLVYNAISSSGHQIYDELQSGKYGDALKTAGFNAALLLSGGPIGLALKKAGQVGQEVKYALFGEASALDRLSTQLFNGDAAAAYNFLKNDPELSKNISITLNTNIAAEGGNVTKGVDRIINGLKNASWDINNTPGETILNDMGNWAKAQTMLKEHMLSKGVSEEVASRFAVGRLTVSDANYISTEITKGASFYEPTNAELLQKWEDMKGANKNASWANNASYDKFIKDILSSDRTITAKADSIRTAEAQFGIKGVSSQMTNKLAKMGYVPIKPVNLEAPLQEAGALKTQFGEGDFFTKSVEPLPVLKSVGSMLTSMGLSPEASTQRVYEVFNDNLASNLEKSNVVTFGGVGSKEENAQYIVKSLSNYVHEMKPSLKSPPITDFRQLTISDIMKAVGVSRQDAQAIKGALMDSMLQVPLAIRGLGDKIVDVNYKINPLAGRYARIQGALRYAWNPFFQARLSYKTEFLTQMEAGGKFPTLLGTNKILQAIMPDKYSQLDDISNMLKRNGIFAPGYAAEGADEAAAGYQALGHTLLKSQERSVAGLVGVMADRVSMTPEEFVTNFPQETKDTVRMILQYDPRSSVLNSPLVRTLNFAFFPFRFNLKVSTIMARNLGKQSLGMQFAVIKGLMSGHQFLNSPEGQAWYSQNADVIGLFKYFSPLEALSSISEALGSKPENVGQYGELGGLPFGWITGLLNSEGIINTDTGYVNPTTGVIAQKYVPISMRGRAQAAIEDLIGSLYTYPGSTVGLPSKTKVDVNIAKGLIPGGSTSKDFRLVTPQLTPQQQQFQQVVQSIHGSQQPAQTSTQPSLSPGVDVPRQPTSLTTPVIKQKSGTRTAKKKKSEFTPQLLPGQTQLGQLP